MALLPPWGTEGIQTGVTKIRGVSKNSTTTMGQCNCRGRTGKTTNPGNHFTKEGAACNKIRIWIDRIDKNIPKHDYRIYKTLNTVKIQIRINKKKHRSAVSHKAPTSKS